MEQGEEVDVCTVRCSNTFCPFFINDFENFKKKVEGGRLQGHVLDQNKLFYMPLANFYSGTIVKEMDFGAVW